MDVHDNKYHSKCQLLQQRCHAIQRDNQRLMDMMHQTGSLVTRLKRQQKVLIKRLERHEPDFRTKRLALFTEVHPEVKQQASRSKNPSSSRRRAKRAKVEPGKDSKGGLSAPKKALNPYLIYCSMHRSSIQEELQMEQKTDMNNQELTKALALKWKFLPQEQKEVYYKLYEQEKERYDKEMKLFTSASAATA